MRRSVIKRVLTYRHFGNHLSVEGLFFDRKLHRADDVDGMQILAG